MEIVIIAITVIITGVSFVNAPVAPCILYMPSLERLGYICYGDMKPQGLPLVLSV